jgi:hypothetical protein
MPKALLLLVVALLGAGGPVFAQSHFKDAIKGAVQGSTLEEIIEWSDRQFARRAAIGRYVRWGGAIVLGSALVYAALDWFYRELKRQTGTSLDTWYLGGLQVAAYCAGYGSGPDTVRCDELYVLDLDCSVLAVYRNVEARGVTFEGLLRRYAPDAVAYTRDGPTCVGPRGRVALNRGVPAVLRQKPRPPLPEFLQSHPDAAGALRDQVVAPYIQAHPIGSPRSPYPGVELQPVPNPNQWTDNPFTRPDIDTDGDGWPDSIEWKEANRRGVPWPDVINNPQVYPDPNADYDGDGWTNLEELRMGTDPYDPISRPRTRTPWVDSDGDGYPDWQEIEAGTDPHDPQSRPDTPPEEKPDEAGWPGGPPPVRPDPANLPEVQVPEKKDLPRLQDWDNVAESWKRNVQDRVAQRFRELQNTLKEKFPFGILTIAQSRSVSVTGAECGVTVDIAGQSAVVNLCDTPVFRFMEGFRPVLLGLLLLGFTYAVIRRGLDVQS